ncbi:MAG: TSUP family transporter [Burkholderiaceae bacterium]|nr:TSUP family transporter [Sulfuritalea sp.]MCF8176781.1 TSUP family transporter [Burkholderiaceae bacterium]MCF8183406.1 TSUP family transporter [Polynucleobacter sp.]
MGELDLVLLLAAAMFAGFVDAVAGGGGLVQVPALLVAMPAESPAMVFGTNKLASVFGTGNAAIRFARRISLPWSIALPAAASAFVFSFGGAMAVSWMPKDVVRPLVLGLLVLVMIYTVVKPGFGALSGLRLAPGQERGRALLVGAVLGFYDGFFGPGAGSFLIFAFVHWFRLDFLHASATAKVVNFFTNLAALFYFVPSGYVLWAVGLAMAMFNILGALFGARLALRHGSDFVRVVFIVVASILIVRLALETFG